MLTQLNSFNFIIFKIAFMCCVVKKRSSRFIFSTGHRRKLRAASGAYSSSSPRWQCSTSLAPYWAGLVLESEVGEGSQLSGACILISMFGTVWQFFQLITWNTCIHSNSFLFQRRTLISLNLIYISRSYFSIRN